MGDFQVIPAPGEHPRLRLATGSGRITVTAEDRSDVVIEATGQGIDRCVPDESGVLVIHPRNRSSSLSVSCPAGSDVMAGTSSGKIELRGEFGRVSLASEGGDIVVDHAREIDARSGSGSVVVGVCRQCRIATKSGRATIGRTGGAEVATESGKVNVALADGSVHVQSASGTVDVGTTGAHDVSVQTLSGAVTVRIPGGVHPEALLSARSGEPRCECDAGSDCRVAVRTLSGKVAVVHG